VNELVFDTSEAVGTWVVDPGAGAVVTGRAPAIRTENRRVTSEVALRPTNLKTAVSALVPGLRPILMVLRNTPALHDERGLPIATFDKGFPTRVSWHVFEELTAMVSATFPPPAGKLCLDTESDRITARGDFTSVARTVPSGRSDGCTRLRVSAELLLTADWWVVVAPAIDGNDNAPVAIVMVVTAASNLRRRTAGSFFVERCSAAGPCSVREFALRLAA
jgi:hypothetical protein